MTTNTLERYKRHIMLKEIGGPGQQRLSSARVLLVGAGALGGPVAQYLVGAGVGALHIFDDDDVDLSNLQRQVHYTSGDVGQPKVDVLTARLTALNPDSRIVPRRTRWTGNEGLDDVDLIIDATDNFETRFALNRLAHEAGCPLVSGAVRQWLGQVSVFHSGATKGEPIEDRLPCYQCFVPEAPPDGEGCDDVGVVGPLTGIVGARLALEALKLITGNPSHLLGRLWIYDSLGGEERTVAIKPDPTCKICG